MAKIISGIFIGLLLGIVTTVISSPSPPLKWATEDVGLQIEQGKLTGPMSFVFSGKGPHPLLKIDADGTVTYQGRILGTDKEVWHGFRAVFDPWRVCQELEERVVPWTSGGQP